MVTVIIPIYNAEPYIDKCVQSVVNQIYKDWECILVDDGSTDGSGEICEKWASIDSRIKVIRQVNQGVSVARNRGLDSSSGEYIVFIDSDDWVEDAYLLDLVENVKDAELVVSGITIENEDKTIDFTAPMANVVFDLSPQGITYFLQLNQQSLVYGPCNKLYLSAIIKNNNICFPVDCNYGEDLLFNFQYLEFVKKVSMVKKSTYHYIRENSTLSIRFRIDQFYNDYEQWVVRRDFLVKKNMFTEEAKNLMCQFLWGIIYDGIFLFPKLENKKKQYIDSILCIEEIETLRSYTQVFSCSWWIKWAILNRCSLLFYFYFKYKQVFRRG